MKLDVLDALAGSGYAALGYVHCEIESNQVVLRGTVPSYHLKQLAQVHAQRVAGVDRIDNRLEVHKRPKS